MTVIDMKFMQSRKRLLLETVDRGLRGDGVVYLQMDKSSISLGHKKPKEVSNVGDFLNRPLAQARNSAALREQSMDEKNFEKNASEFGDIVMKLFSEKGYLTLTDNGSQLCLLNFYAPYMADSSITVEGKSHVLPPNTIAVVGGPLLEAASNGRYKFGSQEPHNLVPYFYTPKSSSSTTSESQKKADFLRQLVEAIDSSLVYFYATSSLASITFPALQKRVRQYSGHVLTLTSIQQILTIDPDAYIVSAAGETYGIKANGLLLQMAQRQKRFETGLNEWARVNETSDFASIPLHKLPQLTTNSTTNKKRSASDMTLQDPLKIQKKVKADNAQKSKTGTLLERIRAKEAAAKNDPFKDERLKKLRYETFIKSQLPQVLTILLSLQSKSYTFEQIVKVLSDSMKLRLSHEESRDVIQRVANGAPQFCSIVKAGNLNAVKLSHAGWNIQGLKNQLCI